MFGGHREDICLQGRPRVHRDGQSQSSAGSIKHIEDRFDCEIISFRARCPGRVIASTNLSRSGSCLCWSLYSHQPVSY